jgi:hypothetical protein
VVILVSLGFIAGKTFELPTISEYWGEKSQKEQIAEYTRSGLKNVKCYGSSVAFSNQMKKVNGVTGVTTFVKTNTVKILFSPDITDTIKIQQAIFSPVRVLLRKPGVETASFAQFSALIDNFFDPMDASYLQQLLSMNKDIYGFTTEFGCPVKVTIFTGSGSATNEEAITGLIHTRTIEQPLTNGKVNRIKLNFRVTSIEKDTAELNRDEFLASVQVHEVK